MIVFEFYFEKYGYRSPHFDNQKAQLRHKAGLNGPKKTGDQLEHTELKEDKKDSSTEILWTPAEDLKI